MDSFQVGKEIKDLINEHMLFDSLSVDRVLAIYDSDDANVYLTVSSNGKISKFMIEIKEM